MSEMNILSLTEQQCLCILVIRRIVRTPLVCNVVIFMKTLEMLLKCVDPLKAITDFMITVQISNILCWVLWEIFRNRNLIEFYIFFLYIPCAFHQKSFRFKKTWGALAWNPATSLMLQSSRKGPSNAPGQLNWLPKLKGKLLWCERRHFVASSNLPREIRVAKKNNPTHVKEKQ